MSHDALLGYGFFKKCRLLGDAEGCVFLPKEMDLESLKSQENVYNVVESSPFEAPFQFRQVLEKVRSIYVLCSSG